MQNLKTNSDLPNRPVFLRSLKQASQNDILNKSDVVSRTIQSRSNTPAGCSAWKVEGATFPHGTKLRGKYKGYYYYGEVDNGAFILNGKQFLSPCAAALSITRNAVDGWLFWDFKLPDYSAWTSIYTFKNT
ncbi:hypothetical protein ACFLYZ_00900 [Thermodesulfobacteriota bacterium]